ncbi:MAG TPA: TraR/DksA C4-type zinc finger protein [Chloroflexota bacterium]
MAKISQSQDKLYRRRLEEERERLLTEIDGMSDLRAQSEDPTLDVESYSNHPANVGSETYEMEKNLGLLDNLRRQLEATEVAMGRLEEGTYGVCSNCGRPIDPERLEALPQAALCIDCKRQQEAQR